MRQERMRNAIDIASLVQAFAASPQAQKLREARAAQRCPAPAILDAYCQGTVEEQQAIQLRLHILGCPRCAQHVAERREEKRMALPADHGGGVRYPLKQPITRWGSVAWAIPGMTDYAVPRLAAAVSPQNTADTTVEDTARRVLFEIEMLGDRTLLTLYINLEHREVFEHKAIRVFWQAADEAPEELLCDEQRITNGTVSWQLGTDIRGWRRLRWECA